MYIGDWMGRAALYWPDRLAVVDAAKGEAGRFTYHQMNERANRLANWLRRQVGLGKGERVGMVALNGVEYLDAFFACGKLGAIFVPFNWRLRPRELADLINLTTPRILIYSDEFQEGIAQVKPEFPSVTHYLHLEGDGITGCQHYEKILLAAPNDPVTTESVNEEDIVCLLFTGGTTGLPKAARISYRMIAWNTLNTILHELDRDDVTITHTPMFHTGGLLVYTLPLLTIGGTVVILRRWDPEEMLQLIEREWVTMFFCVPTQYQQMLQSPCFKTADFSSVRFLTSGGAPLPVPLIKAWRTVHDVPFKQGFGMTEFGPGVFSMEPEFAVSKAGSIGRPNFFVEARLVDEHNRPMPAGEVGELVLRGPSMCSGYFNDPQASAEAVDAEGWFHTGDLARVDADGFYYIVDRKKDMFISGGENVYPAEIEKVLYEHPAVAQCAVVGAPHEKWGEVGAAYVVLKPGAALTAGDLIGFLSDLLATYKVPKHIQFIEGLPLSPAGKILKRELRKSFNIQEETK
ncbi:MAG: long-chain fatty acid--CoA ligase [Anaerolineales bacterium]|nr:long-chain fatty acid--CoA ligase [Anaerolineales bacterium]